MRAAQIRADRCDRGAAEHLFSVTWSHWMRLKMSSQEADGIFPAMSAPPSAMRIRESNRLIPIVAEFEKRGSSKFAFEIKSAIF